MHCSDFHLSFLFAAILTSSRRISLYRTISQLKEIYRSDRIDRKLLRCGDWGSPILYNAAKQLCMKQCDYVSRSRTDSSSQLTRIASTWVQVLGIYKDSIITTAYAVDDLINV